MFIIGDMFIALARVLGLAIGLYLLVLFIRVIISWFPGIPPHNPLVRFICSLTDPLLDYVRRKLKLYTPGFDITPIIVFFILLFVKYFLVAVFYKIGYMLART